MSTFYVRKTGNDGTGTGSSAAPWLTLHQATQKIADTTIAGGETILVGDGTYAEDSLALGFWNINTNPASAVTFQAELGAAGSVVVTGASHATANTLFANLAGNLTFRYLTFTQRVATAIYMVRAANSASNLTFEQCTFRQVSDAATLNYGLYCDPGAGKTISGLAVRNCTFTAAVGDGTFTPITLAAVGGVISGATITGCTVNGGLNGCVLNGVASLTLSGCTIMSKASTGIRVGVDGSAGGAASTVTLVDCTVDMTGATGGHGIMVGNGAVNCIVDGVSILRSFDHALVLKEHGAGGGTEVKNCTLVGGTGAGLLLKAAQNANVHNNQLRASGNLGAIYVTAGDTANKSINNTIRYNDCAASGSGILFYWILAADGGGNVCDYNAYRIGVAGSWGTIPTGVVAGAALATLQAAWATYGIPSNDSHSWLPPVARKSVVGAVMR